MRGLHFGHRRLIGFAGAALVALTGFAGPAFGETIGGEPLASPHRTVSLQPGAEALPDVWAQTWILADATTGQVLAQKGSHVRRAPASTLKMLTALAVMPNTTPEETYVATAKAANIYGSRVGLKIGRSYTLDQLWYAVFLPSANDAAIAVAQANGGVGKTVDEMNAIARDLQAADTLAKTPNGLDSPGQTSSAYDLALIARAGMAREDFSRYAGTAKAEFPNVKGKRTHTIYNTNRLLLHGYDGMLGVKTGFTSNAGRTYVGAARRGDTTLIVSLMGIRESSETAAKKLLDWGFANHDKVTPIGQLATPISAGGTPPVADPTPAASDVAAAAEAAVALPDAQAQVAPSQPSQGVVDAPSGVSSAMLWGALIIAACGAGASMVALRRRRSDQLRGRHAATSA
jgi:serine-type D-Ala-D-Ala carboxypeptidase (penicillin-binding protein 5/6)